MGGLSGRTIYLNAKNIEVPSFEDQDYVCVDGLQRITAMQRFYHDEIPAYGHRYSEFEGRLNSVRFTVRVVTNDLQTREEVLQWYLELNSTGTPHTKKELDRVKALLNREREINSHHQVPPIAPEQARRLPAVRPQKRRRPPER